MKSLVSSAAQFAVVTVVAAGLLSGCASATAEKASGPTHTKSSAQPSPSIDLSAELQRIENQYSSRIGVSALDTGTGATISYRADERFGYASTLKVFVAAGFLSEVSPAERDTVATWTQEQVDAAGYSPITVEHITDGLTLSKLAEASVRSSDNTATNIIFERIGGPAGLGDVLRRAGDDVSDIANIEPDLNTVNAGDTANTTTPAAFTADLHAFVIGSTLAAADRATLLEWMSENSTGDPLIRAGAPEGWVVADKSGGANGMRNDVAIVTPPGRAPIVLTIFTAKNDAGEAYDNNTVSDAASLVLNALK